MKTTFSRIFFIITVALLSTLMVIGTAYQRLAGKFLDEQAIGQLENNAQVICKFAQAVYTNENINSHDFIVAMSLSDALTVSDTAVFDTAGRLVMCSHAPLGCEHRGLVLNSNYLDRILSSEKTVDTLVLTGLYDENRYVVAMPVADPETGTIFGVIMVSAPVSTSRMVLDRIFDIYTFVSVLVAVCSAVLMAWLARKQSSPLKELADTAKAFGHGDLTARVSIREREPREIQELGIAFNNMAAELEKSEYQRQEFVANVSHELKTPMTTISGYVDGILDGTIPQDKSRQYLQVVSSETKRLNRLVRSMLDISKLQDQGGVPHQMKTHFDLTECVGQVLISFEHKIMSKKLDVQVQMPEHPVFTFACQDYITQVVYNLIDNGVKFSPENGTLSVTIQESDTKAFVSIQNQGQTIPPEELPLVFDRFHKTDKSRSQNRDSWGLGLYIVKTIICSHGEDISVTSRDGTTTFTFTLPLGN